MGLGLLLFEVLSSGIVIAYSYLVFFGMIKYHVVFVFARKSAVHNEVYVYLGIKTHKNKVHSYQNK